VVAGFFFFFFHHTNEERVTRDAWEQFEYPNLPLLEGS
jgi:hypothetical protein